MLAGDLVVVPQPGSACVRPLRRRRALGTPSEQFHDAVAAHDIDEWTALRVQRDQQRVVAVCFRDALGLLELGDPLGRPCEERGEEHLLEPPFPIPVPP